MVSFTCSEQQQSDCNQQPDTGPFNEAIHTDANSLIQSTNWLSLVNVFLLPWHEKWQKLKNIFIFIGYCSVFIDGGHVCYDDGPVII